MKRDNPEQLEAAEHFLMIPDYLAFLLTGNMASEYTNASTTSLLNARSKDWDQKILETFGIPTHIFKDVVMAGTELGMVKPEIAAAIGYMPRVIVPATHDTGSAYLAVPARDDDAVFLSSGTLELARHREPRTHHFSRLSPPELHERRRLPGAFPLLEEHHGALDDPIDPSRAQWRFLR